MNAYSYTNSKGQTYYLHKKDVTLKNGRVQTIYFFARDVRDEAIEAVPEGYEVVETKRTGMPVLRKIRTE
jgi:cation diffusion facilitator CzcD-associated flavoprotein CzcO